MKKINYLLFLVLLFIPISAYAKVTCQKGSFSAEVSVSKSSLSINDQSNITISSDYSYEVSYIVNNKSILNIDNNIINPLSVGSTKVSLVFSFLNDEGKSDTCTTNIEITVLSDVSTLSSITLDDEEIEGFSSGIYSYNLEVPYSSEEIIIDSSATDTNAQISGNGKYTLGVGNNVIKIMVTASDKTTSTYTLNIIRNEPSTDATLKSLVVQGYNISPKFSSDIYEYSLSVGENVSNITINCETSNEGAVVTGDGKVSLATGDNFIDVVVSAEDGTVQTYSLVVNKSGGTAYLTSLEVEGYTLDKEFAQDTYTYYLTVDSDVSEIEINAISNDDDQIEIIGNDNLESGTNEVIIRVSGEDKSSTSYKIIITKLSEDSLSVVTDDDNLQNILLIIFIILIIIMVSSIIIFIYINVRSRRFIKKKGVR